MLDMTLSLGEFPIEYVKEGEGDDDSSQRLCKAFIALVILFAILTMPE